MKKIINMSTDRRGVRRTLALEVDQDERRLHIDIIMAENEENPFESLHTINITPKEAHVLIYELMKIVKPNKIIVNKPGTTKVWQKTTKSQPNLK